MGRSRRGRPTCSFDPRTEFAARCSLARTGRSFLPVTTFVTGAGAEGPSRANRDRKDGCRDGTFRMVLVSRVFVFFDGGVGSAGRGGVGGKHGERRDQLRG